MKESKVVPGWVKTVNVDIPFRGKKREEMNKGNVIKL